MLTFEEDLQLQVGATYPLRSMVENLSDEELNEAVESYVKYRIAESKRTVEFSTLLKKPSQ